MRSMVMANTAQRYHRAPVRISATWEDMAGADMTGAVLDLSVGGLFLRPRKSNKAIRPGRWVRVNFRIPGRRQPLRLSGEVRWMGTHVRPSDNGFGVEFDSLNREVAQYLQLEAEMNL